MSFKYDNNQVASYYLKQIDEEKKAAPKSHGMKYFYMRNHYSNLYGYQQSGYHWFYLSGGGENICTCGLKVPKGSTVEKSLGHLELPSFAGIATVFINCCDFNPDYHEYRFGAYCQACNEGSLRNLLKKEVEAWILDHKEDCAERDKFQGLS